MAGENTGLDLASQTGQSNIVTAIGNLVAALANVTGIQGPAGSSIDSISKTGTSGNVDTYTITFTDGGTPATFTVINGTNGTDGVGISSIAKTNTSGNVDTYTITLSNNNTATFTVTNSDISAPVNDGDYILSVASGVASWTAVSNGDGGSY